MQASGLGRGIRNQSDEHQDLRRGTRDHGTVVISLSFFFSYRGHPRPENLSLMEK